jgi:hypothetical protein
VSVKGSIGNKIQCFLGFARLIADRPLGLLRRSNRANLGTSEIAGEPA